MDQGSGSAPKRFGTVAVERGLITPEQLQHALRIQVGENLEQGSHRPIGGILFHQGLLSEGEIQEVLWEMQQFARGAA